MGHHSAGVLRLWSRNRLFQKLPAGLETVLVKTRFFLFKRGTVAKREFLS